MAQSISNRQMAAMMEAQHALPKRRWHHNGYAISIVSSLLMAVAIGLFFIAGAGWSPPESRQGQFDFGVTWLLLTYIWIQMGSLILVGAGTKNQMWIDALTSIVPLFLIVYVVLQHYTGFVVLSSFQAKTAWVTAYTMLLDVVVDLGVTVLLSRQVVDVGGGGVA
jgi:hypothetical protein